MTFFMLYILNLWCSHDYRNKRKCRIIQSLVDLGSKLKPHTQRWHLSFKHLIMSFLQLNFHVCIRQQKAKKLSIFLIPSISSPGSNQNKLLFQQNIHQLVNFHLLTDRSTTKKHIILVNYVKFPSHLWF